MARIEKVNISELEALTATQLQERARELGISGASRLRKRELVMEILSSLTQKEGLLLGQGILEILPEGYGFLRRVNYLPGDTDIYISPSQIRRFNLQTGDEVMGQVRPPKDNERYYAILRVLTVGGRDPDLAALRQDFDDLVPIYPNQRLHLELAGGEIAMRLMDLVAPIGKGQRGLIVAPPKAGKTTLLKNIANSITQNHPEVKLIVLLIDERPEEVTDMERSVHGEVVNSTFDQPAENHVRVAEFVLERAKRLVEQKQDVVILLDSITRLGRAYNLAAERSPGA